MRVTSYLLPLALLSATTAANAQNWPKADGAELGVYLRTDEHRAFTPALRRAILDAVRASFEETLGAGSAVEKVTSQSADAFFANQTGELTSARCASLGFDERPKTLILELAWDRGSYRLAAREFDHVFYSLGPPRSAVVLQRELVPQTLVRLARQVWTPVGEVIDVQEPQVRVRFRRANDPSLPPPKTGDVLQLCRQTWLSEGIKPQTSEQQYLAIDGLEADAAGLPIAVTRLERPQSATTWFSQIGHPRVRYLVRRLDARPGPVTVLVRDTTSPEAREGCEVYLSPQPPASRKEPGKMVGLTDREGKVTLPASNANLGYVTVLYDDLIATQIWAAGSGVDPLVFRMPNREGRLQYRLQFERLRQDVQNRRFQLQRLADELRDAGNNVDPLRAKELVKQAVKQYSFEDERRQLERLELLARGDQLNFAKEIQSLVAEIEKLETDESKGKFEKVFHDVQVADINQQLNETLSKSEWRAAGRLLDRLVTLDPNNAQAVKMRDRFRQAVRPQDAAHAAARAAVERLSAPSGVSVLLNTWPELQRNLEELIRRDDRLYLVPAAKAQELWLELIRNDLLRIRNLTKNPVSQQEKAAFDARKADLEQIANEIGDTLNKAEELLEKGVLADAPPQATTAVETP